MSAPVVDSNEDTLAEHLRVRKKNKQKKNKQERHSTYHIPLIHQTRRHSRRHGHRRSAGGCRLCCGSGTSCHHTCCWALRSVRERRGGSGANQRLNIFSRLRNLAPDYQPNISMSDNPRDGVSAFVFLRRSESEERE